MRLKGIGRSAAAARNGACTGTLRAPHTPLAGPRPRHPEGDFKLSRERRPHVGGEEPPRSEGRRSRHVELGGEVLVVARDNRVDVLGERLREMPHACRGHAGSHEAMGRPGRLRPYYGRTEFREYGKTRNYRKTREFRQYHGRAKRYRVAYDRIRSYRKARELRQYYGRAKRHGVSYGKTRHYINAPELRQSRGPAGDGERHEPLGRSGRRGRACGE